MLIGQVVVDLAELCCLLAYVAHAAKSLGLSPVGIWRIIKKCMTTNSGKGML